MEDRTNKSDPISIFRSFAGSFALGLLLAALGAASSAKNHNAALDATIAKARAGLKACDNRTRKEAAARTAAASLATLWQARATVYAAADAIRAKNYGTAEQNLQDAARLIHAACEEGACDSATLADTMTTHRFSMTSPLEEALTEVAAFGAAVDNLLAK